MDLHSTFETLLDFSRDLNGYFANEFLGGWVHDDDGLIVKARRQDGKKCVRSTEAVWANPKTSVIP